MQKVVRRKVGYGYLRVGGYRSEREPNAAAMVCRFCYHLPVEVLIK